MVGNIDQKKAEKFASIYNRYCVGLKKVFNTKIWYINMTYSDH